MSSFDANLRSIWEGALLLVAAWGDESKELPPRTHPLVTSGEPLVLARRHPEVLRAVRDLFRTYDHFVREVGQNRWREYLPVMTDRASEETHDADLLVRGGLQALLAALEASLSRETADDVRQCGLLQVRAADITIDEERRMKIGWRARTSLMITLSD